MAASRYRRPPSGSVGFGHTEPVSPHPATQPTVHALARLQEGVSRSVQGLADPAPPADDRR